MIESPGPCHKPQMRCTSSVLATMSTMSAMGRSECQAPLANYGLPGRREREARAILSGANAGVEPLRVLNHDFCPPQRRPSFPC